jgi:hypothetical protein
MAEFFSQVLFYFTEAADFMILENCDGLSSPHLPVSESFSQLP